MKTKQVTKLLAVVAFATSPAVADRAPRAVTNQAQAWTAPVTAIAARPDPWAGPAPVTTPVIAPANAPVPAAVRALQSLAIELARPRLMPSGAPACGNVASRAPQPVACTEGSKP